MRFVAFILAGLALAACGTTRVAPVPETGAFSVKYMQIDNDYYLRIEKVGATQPLTLIDSKHPNRENWTRNQWEQYADVLFPADEINFDALRDLRGSNLVPVGLVSPTPEAIPPCETTKNPEYAKKQKRVIREAPRKQITGQVTMVTTCELHEGLSPSQYSGIHQRPNPYRFPTRYETVVDLNRDDIPEQRNVHLRNVKKVMVTTFLESETSVPRDVRRRINASLDRM